AQPQPVSRRGRPRPARRRRRPARARRPRRAARRRHHPPRGRRLQPAAGRENDHLRPAGRRSTTPPTRRRRMTTQTPRAHHPHPAGNGPQNGPQGALNAPPPHTDHAGPPPVDEPDAPAAEHSGCAMPPPGPPGPPGVERSGLPGDGAGGSGDGGGRQRVQVSTGPATVRLLTAALDGRIIPDTYVTDGTPVVIEAVSGAPGPLAGDENAPLPLAITPLRPPLLGYLLAEHAYVVRLEQGKDGEWYDVETSPSQTVLAEVLARRSWPGLPPLRGMIGAPVLRPD